MGISFFVLFHLENEKKMIERNIRSKSLLLLALGSEQLIIISIIMSESCLKLL